MTGKKKISTGRNKGSGKKSIEKKPFKKNPSLDGIADDKGKNATAKTKQTSSPDDRILKFMMTKLMKQNSSITCLDKVGKANKVDSTDTDERSVWKKAWKTLHADGCIQPCKPEASESIYSADFELTEKGIDRVAPTKYREYQALLNAPVNSTYEHHERIKKLCPHVQKGGEIVDLLLKHGPLGKKELSATMGVPVKNPNFFYSLQKLQQLGFVEENAKLLRLSDKAFLHPEEDRPETVALNQKELLASMQKIYGTAGKEETSAKVAAPKSKKGGTSKKRKQSKTGGNHDEEQEAAIGEDVAPNEESSKEDAEEKTNDTLSTKLTGKKKKKKTSKKDNGKKDESKEDSSDDDGKSKEGSRYADDKPAKGAQKAGKKKNPRTKGSKTKVEPSNSDGEAVGAHENMDVEEEEIKGDADEKTKDE